MFNDQKKYRKLVKKQQSLPKNGAPSVKYLFRKRKKKAEQNFEHYLQPCIKINSRWILGLNVKDFKKQPQEENP